MKQFSLGISNRLAPLLVAAMTLVAVWSHAETYVEKIASRSLSGAPFVTVGSRVATEEEAKLVWEMVEGKRASSLTGDEFLQKYPDSPWGASLRAHLAVMHRERGRYTLALRHWETAWKEVGQDDSAAGRGVAEFTVAHWSRLLASLGRVDTLKELLTHTKDWRWQNTEWQAMVVQSAESCDMMQRYPRVSYRCGTLALDNLARALGFTNRSALKLLEISSPPEGFALSALMDMAETNNLGVVAVERAMGSQEIIVPSVVHWRQNHYATILRRHEGAYWVVDPTFGAARWVAGETINEEASGKFMVAATNVPAAWRRLVRAEARTVFGKGLPATIRDWEDRGCDRSPGGAGAAQTSFMNAQAGGNKSVCQTCPTSLQGMARWWVSEPYCNLHIADEPLSYTLSDGSEWAFRWTIKQRDKYRGGGFMDNEDPDERNKSMGTTSLTHNWQSRIVYRDTYWNTYLPCVIDPPTYATWEAMVYLPDGGTAYFSGGSDTDARSRMRLIPISATGRPTQRSHTSMTNHWYWADNSTNGFRLVYPDGSEDIYNLAVETIGCNSLLGKHVSSSTAYLMKRLDPQGRAFYAGYAKTNVANDGMRLHYIVDFDGRTNSLTYLTNSLKITQVRDPYGRTADFQYDSVQRLTNSVDAEGINTGLRYVTNTYDNNAVIVARLTTPYGTTRFTNVTASSTQAGYSLNQGNGGGHDRINRYVVIDEPDGSHEAYVYRYDTPTNVPSSYASGEVPVVSGVTFDNGGADVAGLGFRNSFYFGKKLLSTFAGSLTPNPELFGQYYYDRARVRHWLDTGADTNDSTGVTRLISDRLSMERAPSPDGTTPGQKVWYHYANKPASHRAGDPFITGVAMVLPDGTTRATFYEYDDPTLPYPTSNRETFTQIDGSIGWRTNLLVHSGNGIDLLRVVFPDGTGVTNQYNTLHQVTNTVNGAGERTAWQYSGALSKLTGFTRPNGFHTTLGYNSANPLSPDGGMLQTVSETGINRTVTFTWTNGLPHTVVDERGLHITNTWDRLNRLMGQSYSDGTYISNRYHRLDLFGTKDRRGYWTYFEHDAAQRPTAVTNALTNVTQYSYCGCGALESITDALNGETTLSYDFQSRLTNVVAADNAKWRIFYDGIGRRTQILDGTNAWDYFYNNQGLLTAVSNAAGQVRRIIYDLRDYPVQITDSAGVTVTNTFDAVGRLLTRSYADDGMESFVHNASGLIQHTDPLNAVTHYVYDLAGRLNAVTNANHEVTQFTYDAASDLRELIDGKNRTNRWHYDVFGRMASRLNAYGQTNLAFAYDANDRVTNRWTPAKGDTLYDYDAVGNLWYVNYPSMPSVLAEYDALNRLVWLYDGLNAATTQQDTLFTWTKTGLLASEDGPGFYDRLTNFYTQQWRTESRLMAPTGPVWPNWTNRYEPDSARRIGKVISGAGSFTQHYAGASSLRSQTLFPGGAKVENLYDTLGQLTNTALLNVSSTVLQAQSYSYDLRGQRTVSRAADGTRVDYGYDEIGQLKTALPYDTNSALINSQRLGYGYDAAGNVAFRTNDITVRAFATDDLNQLNELGFAAMLSVSGVTTTNATNVTVNGVIATLTGTNYTAVVPVGNGTNSVTAIGYELYGRTATNTVVLIATPQYDANENLLFDGKRAFEYDDENRLSAITETNTWRTEWIYDAFGRRRLRKEFTWSGGAWSQTNETYYVFDGRLLMQERDSNGVIRVTYTRGPDLSGNMDGAGGIGGLLARTDTSGSAFYHSDAGGNVSAMINSSQSLVAQYRYDPFGNVQEASGAMAAVNELQFSSQPFHAKSRVSLYHARGYAPNLQRFTQSDPIGFAGGINLHRFVENDPVNSVDPWGWDNTYNPSAGQNAPVNVIASMPVSGGPVDIEAGGTDEFLLMWMHYFGGDPLTPFYFLQNLGVAIDGDREERNEARVRLAMMLVFRKCLKTKGTDRNVLHHTTPRAILKQLPKPVRDHPDVLGRPGKPNKWPVPESWHKRVHSSPPGDYYPGGDYNRRFDELIRANGGYPAMTPKKINLIRDQVMQEFTR